MEEQLVQALAGTQLPAEGPRKKAEHELAQLRTDAAFPVLLAKIASHTAVALNIRQAALSSLSTFVRANWSPDGEEDDDENDAGPPVSVSDETRAQVRSLLLELVLSNEDERKIKGMSR
jgi:hypothetical protein